MMVTELPSRPVMGRVGLRREPETVGAPTFDLPVVPDANGYQIATLLLPMFGRVQRKLS